ncbi:MAG: hypothetical protein JNJ83_24370 [Verrucomicrobiaceae bacterium]|nr:hypothetical protein [Verrucomicrobiaceae bacterium]
MNPAAPSPHAKRQPRVRLLDLHARAVSRTPKTAHAWIDLHSAVQLLQALQTESAHGSTPGSITHVWLCADGQTLCDPARMGREPPADLWPWLAARWPDLACQFDGVSPAYRTERWLLSLESELNREQLRQGLAQDFAPALCGAFTSWTSQPWWHGIRHKCWQIVLVIPFLLASWWVVSLPWTIPSLEWRQSLPHAVAATPAQPNYTVSRPRRAPPPSANTSAQEPPLTKPSLIAVAASAESKALKPPTSSDKPPSPTSAKVALSPPSGQVMPPPASAPARSNSITVALVNDLLIVRQGNMRIEWQFTTMKRGSFSPLANQSIEIPKDVKIAVTPASERTLNFVMNGTVSGEDGVPATGVSYEKAQRFCVILTSALAPSFVARLPYQADFDKAGRDRLIDLTTTGIEEWVGHDWAPNFYSNYRYQGPTTKGNPAVVSHVGEIVVRGANSLEGQMTCGLRVVLEPSAKPSTK